MTDAGGGYSGRRVLVTGGAGFIGSNLCDALVERGADVVVLDDLSNGFTFNLADIREDIEFIEGSILDRSLLERAVEGVDVVFHQAAIASVPRSVKEPVRYAEVNATGTVNVLDAARCAGVRRVVYAASSSAYGDQPGLPRVETMAPDLRSPYAAAKCAGEHAARAFASCYDLETVSLRYFNIFGPRQRPDSAYAAVVPRFTAALITGERPLIYGDGEQTRDFTYVANAVHANLLAGTVERPLAGEVVNIACGERASLRDLVGMIGTILGVPVDVEHAEPRPGEVQHSLADINAAKSLLGYEPVVRFGEGLMRAVAWYRERME